MITTITAESHLARLAAIRAQLPHTPGLDCYVLGCKTPPYLTTRDATRGIVTTCQGHDPWRHGRGCNIYPWNGGKYPYTDLSTADPATATTPEAVAAAPDPAKTALRFLRALIQLAGQDDPDQDENPPQGGTKVPVHPIPPTRPPGTQQLKPPTFSQPLQPTPSAPVASIDFRF